MPKLKKGKKPPEYPLMGARLKAARQALPGKPSHAKIAEDLDISRQQYGNYEKGLSMPPAGKIPALCKRLGISEQELYADTRTGPPPSSVKPPTDDRQLLDLHALWDDIEQVDRNSLLDLARRFSRPNGDLKKSGTD